MTRRKVPSSKGVSEGPMMTAFLEIRYPLVVNVLRESVSECKVASYQVMTLSAIGDAETPAGGSVCIRCISILVCVTLRASGTLS